MQYKKIQGVDIPELGLGTYKLYGKECNHIVRTAFDLGYRLIDTAQMYKNEREIGEAINQSGIDRHEIYLIDKVWHTNLDHDVVLQSVEDSLKELKTPYIDLLLIHWPNEQYSLEQTFEAMLTLRDQGKVLDIGVSNFPIDLLKHSAEDLRIPLLGNQVEYHPYLGQFDLMDYSYEKDLAMIAYSPLAQGKVNDDSVLNKIGEDYGKSAAQVALRWLIEQENVIAIPKTTSIDHLKLNLDIFDFHLSDEHFDQINDLERNERLVNPSFAPDW